MGLDRFIYSLYHSVRDWYALHFLRFICIARHARRAKVSRFFVERDIRLALVVDGLYIQKIKEMGGMVISTYQEPVFLCSRACVP